MAVDFKAKHSRTSEYRFYPEDITVKPSLNGRYDKPDVEALIQDILVNGQHTPVVIRNDGGRATLCAGYSRYRAVSEINKRKLLDSPLQLRCTYSQCSESEGFLAAISENRVRNSTTELDDAHNIARLMKVYAKTEDEVAMIYFPGCAVSGDGVKALKDARAFVKKRLALINLTPEAEQAMRDGRLKGSAAVAVAKLDQENQKAALAKSPEGKIAAPKKNGKPPLKTLIATALDKGIVEVDGVSQKIPDWLDNWLRPLVQK